MVTLTHSFAITIPTLVSTVLIGTTCLLYWTGIVYARPPFVSVATSFVPSPRRTHIQERSRSFPWKNRNSFIAPCMYSKGNSENVAEHLGYRVLYPPSTAHTNGTIKVDALHTLYYEEHGLTGEEQISNRSSTNHEINSSVSLFLHGGPGAGCTPDHARFFDPTRYRIVLLDQRGSGRSTPRGEVCNNTLKHLVDDCEILRTTLRIPRWDVVLGGSWGSTLALAYAQSFPNSVGALVLRGVCAMRQVEVDWLFSSKGGAASLNPKGWAEFEESVGVEINRTNHDNEPREALYAHYDRLLGDDPKTRIEAAWSWFKWEMSVTSSMKMATDGNATTETHRASPVLVWESENGWSRQHINGTSLPDANVEEDSEFFQSLRKFGFGQELVEDDETDQIRPLTPIEKDPLRNSSKVGGENSPRIPAQSMITCFYSVNNEYAMNNISLVSEDRIKRIRDIPCIALQGESDMVCPVDTALDLLELWPEMELRVPIAAGHSMYHPAITHELLQATDRFAKKSRKK